MKLRPSARSPFSLVDEQKRKPFAKDFIPPFGIIMLPYPLKKLAAKNPQGVSVISINKILFLFYNVLIIVLS